MIRINAGFIEIIKQTTALYSAHLLILNRGHQLVGSHGACPTFQEVSTYDDLNQYVGEDLMDKVKQSVIESTKSPIRQTYFGEEQVYRSLYVRKIESNSHIYLFFVPNEGVEFMHLIDQILRTQKHVNNPLKINRDHAANDEKKLEQDRYFFNQVMDLVPNLIYVVNHDNMSNDYANRELTEILGYTIEEVQEMGNIFETLVHKEDLASLYIYLGNIKSLKDNEVSQLEYRVLDSDRQVRWLCSRDIVFERDEKGEVTKHLGVATDITSMKEIKEIQKQLIDMNREMEEFTHLAAHDLKGPLSSIQSMVSILETSCQEFQDDNEELFLWLNKSILSANKKVKSLTDIARVRFDPTLNYEACVLESVLEDALIPLHQEILNHQVEIKSDFKALTEVTFSKTRLDSILFNLLSNAVKYRNPKIPTQIEVSSSVEDGFYVISVKDNGLGIDLPKDENKVFGLFKRAHLVGEGDGLGLYIIKKMIEKDGGKLTVSSTLGKGSTFHVKLKK